MIVHVLKDGTRVDDVAGHIVRGKETEALYKLLRELRRKEHVKSR